MKKWEYLTVEFYRHNKAGSLVAQGKYHPRWINGEELEDWKELPTFHDYLEGLGEKGWELAGNGPSRPHAVCCVFKREFDEE